MTTVFLISLGLLTVAAMMSNEEACIVLLVIAAILGIVIIF